MKKLLILLFVVSLNSYSAVNIEYPDLSSSKQTIKNRHTELLEILGEAKKNESGYKLAEVYGKLGMFYQAHEYFKPAEQAYLNSKELANSNAKWHYLLGVLYKNEGEFEKAQESFFNSWKYNKSYIPAMVYLAEMLYLQGDFIKAQEYFKQVLATNKKNARALVGIGKIQQQEGDFDSAIESYKKAIALQPQANQINFLLAQAYAATGNQEMAKKYNLVKGKIQAQIYDPLILNMLNESRSSTFYNDKAIRSFQAKDYKNAEIFAQKAISLDSETVYPYVTLANIYVSTGRALEASKLLEKVIKVNQEDVNLLYSLGVIEEILTHDDKSIYWYEKVLSSDPEHKKASITLASAYMRKGQFDKALAELKRARRLNPSNPYLLTRQAVIYAHKGQCVNAQNKMYAAVKELPKNFAFLEVFIKIAIQCDVDKQMEADALNAARNIYNITPNDTIVELLAMIESKSGNKDNAIDYQAQAIFKALSDNNKEKIKQLKENLELYKKGDYPKKQFKAGGQDLYPSSFTRVKN